MKRGDVVTIATGAGFGGKPRPAVIVQDDRAASISTILVAPITSSELDRPLARPRILPDSANALHKPSNVMVDKLLPVYRDQVGGVIGRMSLEDMHLVDEALRLVLGLTR